MWNGLKNLFARIDDNSPLFRSLRRKAGFIRLKGVFEVKCFDKDGNLKWSEKLLNGVTTVGLNHILNVQFGATAKSATWYLGLIDLASFSALAAADTMASHAGWLENTNYAAATRPSWGAGVATGGSITNAAAVNFAMNASVTIKGFFAVDVNTKGGTTGNLWATALFSGGDQAVVSGDSLQVTYTVTAT